MDRMWAHNDFEGLFNLNYSFRTHIPARHRASNTRHDMRHDDPRHDGMRHGGERDGYQRSGRRDAMREVHLDGGNVPPLGGMGEEVYTAWIRDGMSRLRQQQELESLRKAELARQQAQLQQEQAKKLAAEQERERKRRELEKHRLDQGKRKEEGKKKERERYVNRWKSVQSLGGEVEESQLKWDDIPWPIYSGGGGLEREGIRAFLWDLAEHPEVGGGGVDGGGGAARGGTGGGGGGGQKMVLREAIRNFHPDRFFSRILERVKASDQEKVKDGVEVVVRVVNDLLRESRH